MPSAKLEKKVRGLEGLVLANRYGARTIWSGFMITIVASLLSVVVFIPVIIWVGASAEKQGDGSVSLVSGGWAAVIVMLFVILAYYIALIVGVVKMILGFYRMSHPEKYAERVLEKESVE